MSDISPTTNAPPETWSPYIPASALANPRTNKSKRQNHYSRHTKIDVIQQIQSNQPLNEISRTTNIPEATLRYWKNNSEKILSNEGKVKNLLQCSKCDKTFTRKESLIKHQEAGCKRKIKKKQQTYSVDVKLNALEQIRAGKSPSEVQRELNIPGPTLRYWRKNADQMFSEITKCRKDAGEGPSNMNNKHLDQTKIHDDRAEDTVSSTTTIPLENRQTVPIVNPLLYNTEAETLVANKPASQTQPIYVIPDTNAFIDDLPLIEHALRRGDQVQFFIPHIVTRELNHIKDSHKKTRKLRDRAQECIRFINSSSDDVPNKFKIQSIEEHKVNEVKAVDNDDYILNCVYQVKKNFTSKIIVLTSDQGLKILVEPSNVKVISAKPIKCKPLETFLN